MNLHALNFLAPVLALCQEREVEAVFVAEVGSRAQGFFKLASDHDLRFVYRHPVRRYLGLSQPSETVQDLSVAGLDMVGFDLRKFMRLLSLSNVTAIDMLCGTVLLGVPFREHAIKLVGELFNPRAMYVHHYQWGINARGRRLLDWKKPENSKAYRHAMRSFLTLEALDSAPHVLPPTTFSGLRSFCPLSLLDEFDLLGEDTEKPKMDEWLAHAVTVKKNFDHVPRRELSQKGREQFENLLLEYLNV